MNYIEVTFQPTADITPSFLWKKVFSRIHYRLVSMQNEKGNVQLGLSFPEYSENPPTLGVKFRIIAEDSCVLEDFDVKQCLNIFQGYVHISGLRIVPEKVQYVTYRRVQPQDNVQRIARRKARRENISLDDALRKLEKFKVPQISLPYIQVKSVSSGKSFSLFIKKEAAELGENFVFNTYGLSNGGIVPEF